MRPSVFLAIAVGVLLCSSTASGSGPAQDGTIVPSLINDGANLILNYNLAGCGYECPVVGFLCRSAGDVEVWLANLSNEAVRTWIFEMTPTDYRPTADLVVDGAAVTMNVVELSFGGGGNLLSNWWVILSPTGDWLGQFGAAGRVMIETPVVEIALPATPEDRAARTAFLTECLAR